ncbi:sigma-70 family RNA polymerase sigma factor [Streptomyces sp. DSM 44917]|uniref:Sigma-70 family RNA polymerase sigma factor n=1 Tax=Streptomyces boetiae TaxID=3075541 RepID=A0ABU2LER8_9ACTN|nr:sigma-70 family RNA polymerase sigma factor [Streptomyces sp. DSM 44917]MDT0309763.1 sigma-70 family RNA polymerase sigma factor [Streptomyces sp. DSM 44917]
MAPTETVRGPEEPRRGKARKRLLPGQPTTTEVIGNDHTDRLPPACRDQWRQVLGMRKACLVLAYRYVPQHQCEDVWQETKLAMWQLLKKGPVDKVGPYVRQVCRNKARQHLRVIKERAEQLIEDAGELDTGSGGNPPQTDGRLKDLVRSFDGVLSPHEALICVLKWGVGLDAAAVARLIGPPTTAAAVRQALRRARGKLERPGVREQVARRIRADT